MVYDRAYRWIHRLDRPGSEIGPALSVEIRRCRRPRTLPDGTSLGFGDRVGICHLNNPRIAAIHLDARSPLSVGLEFRRQLVVSLQALAALAVAGRPLSDVQAFAATTIFHPGLTRLGFTAEPRRPAWPRLVAAYQRALLASIHPNSSRRLSRATSREARRLWLSRDTLLARYLERPGVTGAAGV
ncbi:MAG: YkoP family protein [Candidatus Rokuibacteriota bacterium]